jgi:hypothetical protein
MPETGRQRDSSARDTSLQNSSTTLDDVGCDDAVYRAFWLRSCNVTTQSSASVILSLTLL